MRVLRKGTFYQILITLSLMFSYQNCSMVKSGAAGGETSGETVLSSSMTCEPALYEVFQNDLHPLMVAKCAKCHVSGGIGKTKFAESDFSTAWEQFKTIGNRGPQKAYTNGTNPAHSGDSNLTGSSNEPVLHGALDKFNTLLASCVSGNSGILTNRQLLSTVNAADKTFVWNLNDELDSKTQVDYGEAFFIVSIRKSADNKSYSVSNLKIRTYEKGIGLGSIKVYINGREIATTTVYQSINKEIPSYTSEESVDGSISPLTSIIPMDVKTTDYIQFSFARLEAN